MVRWKGRRRSSNVIDLRGRGAKGAALGCGPILVILLALLFGVDPSQLLALFGDGASAPAPAEAPAGAPAEAPRDDAGEFVSVILADTEETWHALFPQGGYREPELVLYDGTVRSACGLNSAATGPFYCPPDRRVYLDTSFFRYLQRLGAPGDFAVAYVIAHEIGHHVQNLQGTLQEVSQYQRQLPPADANALSVRTELQADCYAGVWAHYAEAERDLLEAGDVEEGLRAAAAVGDDHLLERAGQPVRPDAFTHGTSAQRMEWFRRGLETGDPAACDTFQR
ncbi:MAG: neutral zinc metallopeptidase [Rhodothermales bacterium]|nr:neutral zinc metallopeptidase [Rhodothermales bacterium]